MLYFHHDYRASIPTPTASKTDNTNLKIAITFCTVIPAGIIIPLLCCCCCNSKSRRVSASEEGHAIASTTIQIATMDFAASFD